MPIMQYHSKFHHHRPPLRDRTPWHVQKVTGDERVLPVFRRYAHLRERLVPYLAEQARATIATGRPLMRALFFDHPDDAHIWQHPQQYQLGDDLLINPVTQPGATEWTTYLPDGDWVDVWTGEHLEGKTSHQRAVPIDEVPVYCRPGAWQQLQPLLLG